MTATSTTTTSTTTKQQQQQQNQSKPNYDNKRLFAFFKFYFSIFFCFDLFCWLRVTFDLAPVFEPATFTIFNSEKGKQISALSGTKSGQVESLCIDCKKNNKKKTVNECKNKTKKHQKQEQQYERFGLLTRQGGREVNAAANADAGTKTGY